MTSRQNDPFDYLLSAPFDAETTFARCPNARRTLDGGVFVSHAGRDLERVRSEVEPVLSERDHMARYFLHDRRSGAPDSYVELVHAALVLCPIFLLAASYNSVKHRWVIAEVTWAVRNRRPIIVCILDDVPMADVDSMLVPADGSMAEQAEAIIEFVGGGEAAASQLNAALARFPPPPAS